MEEYEFLAALLLYRTEVFLMGSPETGQYGDGGLYDVAQGEHLAGLTDACLEYAHLCLLVHKPYGQGHTNLRIVTPRTACNEHSGREQLVQPLLDHGLAIGAGYANYGYIEFITMAFGQALQSLQRIDHLQEIGFRIVRRIAFRHLRHYKVSYTSAVQFRYVVVTVIAL